MTEHRPLIFVTNDDGIEAPGLKALIDAVKDKGEVIAVAPALPQSGKSSAITCDDMLRVTARPDYGDVKMYAVGGTPVDCVKIGLFAVVDRKPDLLVSGINHGSNSGDNVNYSGTMGAVMEGCLQGIPSIGFSLLHHSWQADFSRCGKIISEVTGNVLAEGLPADVCLNVNIPAKCEPKGLKVAEASRGRWSEEYSRYTDPHGRPYYWLTGTYIDLDPDDDRTDNYWLARQYATIVPVRPDQTYRPAIAELARRFE